ncbi:TIGR00300 family protein [Aquihabitans sp. G128]|uniref:ornithine cyclodeaminase n=1 Tax=Aquihabitans sp. G128 TaxID=2849779 RepID=UPI001C233ABB|nr:TIGR00300 family protein [Aquihabitans sp. G128]QXC62845.1 TIGR00300 family protein [Aquihabitans sp. G128]
MAVTETYELEGHIVDSLLLAKVLDLVLESGADYRLELVDIGRTATDSSRVVIEITAEDDEHLLRLAEQLQVHGVNPLQHDPAVLEEAATDGVLPTGFHSTTNLATEVNIGGRWVPVVNPEMDCGIVVVPGADGGPAEVRTVPMHRVRAGDQIVVGGLGVRVRAPRAPKGASSFEFMDSDVSSEKPKGLQLTALVERLQAAREAGEKVLVVCGPAVVHTGGAPEVARLVRAGWIDVLFAGNGFATHDIESNVLGTSLGVSVTSGAGTEGGHSNHLRVINEIRGHGSIAAAVEAGYVGGGVMYELTKRGLPFVLGGSIRDDGPLPDTTTDVVAAADRMRELVPGVGVALMLATTLHAIATGNLLPGAVDTWCIDINQAVVTKLADRGSHQARGIVTDVGPFLRQLADQLGA